jgi:hypothetical protein
MGVGAAGVDTALTMSGAIDEPCPTWQFEQRMSVPEAGSGRPV